MGTSAAQSDRRCISPVHLAGAAAAGQFLSPATGSFLAPHVAMLALPDVTNPPPTAARVQSAG
jgi:hypothetical protein